MCGEGGAWVRGWGRAGRVGHGGRIAGCRHDVGMAAERNAGSQCDIDSDVSKTATAALSNGNKKEYRAGGWGRNLGEPGVGRHALECGEPGVGRQALEKPGPRFQPLKGALHHSLPIASRPYAPIFFATPAFAPSSSPLPPPSSRLPHAIATALLRRGLSLVSLSGRSWAHTSLPSLLLPAPKVRPPTPLTHNTRPPPHTHTLHAFSPHTPRPFPPHLTPPHTFLTSARASPQTHALPRKSAARPPPLHTPLPHTLHTPSPTLLTSARASPETRAPPRKSAARPASAAALPRRSGTA
eukprot:187074-Chlamydomonas_euryale.AAC.2